MDIGHLELLRELRDRGTITAVAAAGFRTPSAVSQQLRSAERSFGIRLVEPDGRRLRLTTAGRLLADGAVEVSASLARLQRELDGLRGDPAGTVSICGLPSASEALLPPLLKRLAGTKIEVTISDDDIAEADFAGRAADHDLVIAHSLAERPTGTAGLDTTTLANEPLDVALPANHRLTTREHINPEDLAGEDWIGVPIGFPFDTVRVAIENRSGASLNIVQRVKDNRLVEALVAQGLGCGLLPRFTTRPRPDVVIRPLAGVRATRRIVAISRPDRTERAAVRLVADALTEIGRQLR
ncbi:LysR family transcriptional regulator [Propionicimonas sp.]|uniref:LysR family transcriptional regulator n=1 Tax=Propionicimonas sp. TaxID=1955623 RepID=UPI0017F101C7|nr:LysR family transcriptional regulator [Propionicimonas sp.]MBU3977859.1 LysR family transcriptional regulator [Actinomycetota bacterium]MBA3021917.1 LysR family transcriptional regulator [Propionicimonas sp.]MBU3987636.1 LysR family transcriptional regulator [Actinomycetota bacterium]MBU4007358.1 LysR family transcriptional regulator [Actinomycetota bacterium]MBU4065696.1 LysR family transcriptional regulator [Actinomycetota bacterium]